MNALLAEIARLRALAARNAKTADRQRRRAEMWKARALAATRFQRW